MSEEQTRSPYDEALRPLRAAGHTEIAIFTGDGSRSFWGRGPSELSKFLCKVGKIVESVLVELSDDE